MLTPPRVAPIGMFDSAPSSASLAETALLLFDRLGPLHRLPGDDRGLLVRSAVGLRFIRAMGAYSTLEHELFGLALAELPAADACVVEAAACLAADEIALDGNVPLSAIRSSDRLRALWFAAILRLADALLGERRASVGEVYVAWTHSVLYVEIDGVGGCDEALVRCRSRLSALEAVSGRRVVLTSSARRRGVA